MSAAKRFGLLFLGLGLLLAALFALRLAQYVHAPLPIQWVRIEIPPGSGAGTIGSLLTAAGLGDWRLGTRLGLRFWSRPGDLKAGTYVFAGPVTLRQVFADLEAGRVEQVSVTLPEGLTARQMAEALEAVGITGADEFSRLAYDAAAGSRWDLPGPSLEGFLFPDTYRFGRGQEAEVVVEAMVERFRDAVAPLLPVATEQGWDLLAWTTLASIIEKEAGVDGEKPLVAAVFRNRLDRGMRLESDPTVIYGIVGFDGNIRKRDLQTDTPYNTYTRKGLPPGPVANPGRESLEAVLYPAEVPYLYFVSRNDGTHHFSETYEEHRAAVRRYQGGNR